MDDNLSTMLELQNSFGFPPNFVVQSSTTTCYSVQSQSTRLLADTTSARSAMRHSDSLCHSFSTSGMSHLEVPEFIADSQTTPSSATSSLTTPTQPLFIFPPAHTYQSPTYPTPDLFSLQPFPSEERGWFPSITDAPFPDPNAYLQTPPSQPARHPIPHVNAYDGYANDIPNDDDYGVQVPTLPNPTFHADGDGMHHPLLNDAAWPVPMGMVQQASGCNLEDISSVSGIENGGCHRMPKGKAEGQSILVFQDAGHSNITTL
jgi:hypothetical protein